MISRNSFEGDKRLSELSTFGIGGIAKYFMVVRSTEELQELLAFCYCEHLPWIIIGKGSNSLFNDRGFDGLAIHNKIDFLSHLEGVFHVGAGYSFSLLGTQTARLGWSGLEFASGIPGTVGGAIYMNAGANGQETCETLKEVEYITEKGELVSYRAQELHFDYRFSSFQQRKGAIVGARFHLIPSEKAREKQMEIIQYRLKTQPYTEPSIGCIFKNPKHEWGCASAGALIEQSGLKGRKVGGAMVSLKHANFIINHEGATAEDVLNLIALIKDEVRKKTGVSLEEEIRVT